MASASVLSEYKAPISAHFSPYDFNGGTVLAIAGNDFALIATDTRLSQGFAIHSRECPKTFTLTNNTILGCCGFHGDVLTLTKTLAARLQIFEKDHNKPMPTASIAAMLSTILYYRRFFPYYTHNVVAGLDEEGKGCVYSFDPVGCYEKESFRAKGSASAMLQPLLDNQIGGKNQNGYTAQSLTSTQCVALVKDVFTSAAERDIYTGDNIIISVVNKDGIKSEKFPLRRD
ncbi:proteasome subunit beta type-1-like [Biomphalaria glabrata]|uniref:Proteasome subunit beta n=1 Tax=Biomphalaria glabrata TaxID=6526 RepID=A0A9W3BAZ5_BIOGL|nr:proteasome subunit beta type-1-like [Biomphalaria glabrata]